MSNKIHILNHKSDLVKEYYGGNIHEVIKITSIKDSGKVVKVGTTEEIELVNQYAYSVPTNALYYFKSFDNYSKVNFVRERFLSPVNNYDYRKHNSNSSVVGNLIKTPLELAKEATNSYNKENSRVSKRNDDYSPLRNTVGTRNESAKLPTTRDMNSFRHRSKFDLRPPQGFDSNADQYYLMDIRTGEVLRLVFPPESLDESLGIGNYNSSSPVGRSSPIVTYENNRARSISIQFVVIDDYYKQSMEEIHAFLASINYPEYKKSAGLIPPNAQLRLGKLVIRGVITGLNTYWEGPIRSGNYTRLKVSLTVEEVREIPLSRSEVVVGGLNR